MRSKAPSGITIEVGSYRAEANRVPCPAHADDFAGAAKAFARFAEREICADLGCVALIHDFLCVHIDAAEELIDIWVGGLIALGTSGR